MRTTSQVLLKLKRNLEKLGHKMSAKSREFSKEKGLTIRDGQSFLMRSLVGNQGCRGVKLSDSELMQ